MSRILFIGESPSKTGNGEPLTGNSGKFLAELCGQTHKEFLSSHRVHNYFDENGAVENSPSTIMCWSKIDLIVVLGDKVAHSMIGWIPGDYELYKLYLEKSMYGDIKCLVVIPHPSKRNRHWNIEQNVINAKEILQTLCHLFR